MVFCCFQRESEVEAFIKIVRTLQNGGKKFRSRFVCYNGTVDEMVKENLRDTFHLSLKYNLFMKRIYEGLFKAFILWQYEMGLKEFDLALDKIEILLTFERIYSSGNYGLQKLLVCLVDELLGKFY